MYERHFGFNGKPFAITPDPAFLYLSRQHERAITLLEYGLEAQAAFMLMTGEIGSGKTMLVRRLLRSLANQVVVGLISNTHASFNSIHDWALCAFGIVPESDSPTDKYEALVDLFVREYAKGRRTLLILDEAQNLTANLLEELRLLSNVNSETDLVLQVLLVGQPELRDTLRRPELRQFAQRISVDFHLQSLDRRATAAYIQHRLAVAGGSPHLFDAAAVDFIYAQTQGVPRLLNHLCDMALVSAYAEARQEVGVDLLLEMAKDRGGGQILLPGATRHALAPPDVTDDLVV